MLIGSGMLARAFAPVCDAWPEVWIHAAGVSNSACQDRSEFERERLRLIDSLESGSDASAFVYFSTCSIYDPHTCESSYVRHKMDMECLVAEHPRSLIVRLPQVAGKTPNPHTLLNYLYARVSRSERFAVWENAKRNIIDIVDVVEIVRKLLDDPLIRGIKVNVANSRSFPIAEIVSVMEKVTGKAAVVEIRDEGGAYEIDTTLIVPIVRQLGMAFDDQYLPAVIGKYYGANRADPGS